MRVAAFQNGYFTALCNRVGNEDCLNFAGESFVCGPDGEVIARAAKSRDEILYAEIDYAKLAECNARRLFMKHRRPELYGDWLTRAKTN
jgi:N-carbamoylputrescine amidase